MANVTADDYKKLFEDSVVIRPYLYVDAAPVHWSKNVDGSISTTSCSEIMKMLKTKTTKKSHMTSMGILPPCSIEYLRIIGTCLNDYKNH